MKEGAREKRKYEFSKLLKNEVFEKLEPFIR